MRVTALSQKFPPSARWVSALVITLAFLPAPGARGDELQEMAVLFEQRKSAKMAKDSKSFSLNYEPFETHIVRIRMK